MHTPFPRPFIFESEITRSLGPSILVSSILSGLLIWLPERFCFVFSLFAVTSTLADVVKVWVSRGGEKTEVSFSCKDFWCFFPVDRRSPICNAACGETTIKRVELVSKTFHKAPGGETSKLSSKDSSSVSNSVRKREFGVLATTR